MPTAPKLVAAVLFALTGFLAAEAFKGVMPDGMAFGAFSLVIAGIGLICGWRISGKYAGQGIGSSIGYGLRTSVTIAFWGLVLYSIERMIQRALDMLYKDTMEAVVGVFDLMMQYGLKIVTAPEVLITLAVGAVLTAIAVEIAARRWR